MKGGQLRLLRLKWLTAVTLFCALSSGCVYPLVREKYQRPEVPAPAAWQGVGSGQAGWPDREWWKSFKNGELDQFIARAQDGNHDLRAAAARVDEAQATARIAGAALYPTLELGAEAKGGKGGSVNSFLVQPQASYAIDVWGANRDVRDAARDQALSSLYAAQALKLTLTAEVATAYFQILSLNDRLDDARRNLTNARRLMDLIQAQREAGRVSAFEVERQQSQVATNEAAIPPLEQQLHAARDALAVLLGTNPEDLTVTTASLRPLAAPIVPVGIPGQLLERRPDIRQAEMDLIAAHANLAAARAALFPSVTSAAQLGFTSSAFHTLFTAASRAESISVALLATIFDGGKLRGGVDLARAKKIELAETYRQSIVSSLGQVEDALAGVEQFTAEEVAQQNAAVHAREAYRLAELQLRAGSADFTAVLDAERTLLAVETAADEARFSRFSALVELYRALGGGWQPGVGL